MKMETVKQLTLSVQESKWRLLLLLWEGWPLMTKTTSIDATLAERGSRYGSFNDHARITQDIKRVMQTTPNWSTGRLSDHHIEALEMIAHKIGRILNGDPNYADSWHDIAGYAKLVEDYINGTRT
jgi:hypothetical protein